MTLMVLILRFYFFEYFFFCFVFLEDFDIVRGVIFGLMRFTLP